MDIITMDIITIQSDSKGKKRQVIVELVPKVKKKTCADRLKQKCQGLWDKITPEIEL